MGLEDSEFTEDDGDGGEKSVSCSICLEMVVTENGDRSWSKLQCGHLFHLDCIGSAFNIKGAMQCPNCRNIEKGQWLYSNGCHPLPEFSMDDWHDEDLYDLSYAEMSSGVHWCPFNRSIRLPSFLDGGEFERAAYHDIRNAAFPERAGVTSATHPCPYIAYIGPIHHPSSNSSASVSDGSNFSNHWNAPSVPGEVMSTFPAMDVHYHSWDHHSSPFTNNSSRIGSGEQPSVPSVTQRPSNLPRSGSFVQPFLVGHSSSGRAGSSIASSMMPPYPGSNARARDRVQALQAYYQPPNNSPANRTPNTNPSRRAAQRGLAAGSSASSSDQNGGFYYFPSGTFGRNFMEAENHLPTHMWERGDHFTSYPSNQIERDSSWGPFHHSSGLDSSIRSSSHRQRHGSERTSSQNGS